MVDIEHEMTCPRAMLGFLPVFFFVSVVFFC